MSGRQDGGFPCAVCGAKGPISHNTDCLALARLQREQLRQWRAAGGEPGPRWASREARIKQLLEGKVA